VNSCELGGRGGGGGGGVKRNVQTFVPADKEAKAKPTSARSDKDKASKKEGDKVVKKAKEPGAKTKRSKEEKESAEGVADSPTPRGPESKIPRRS
jgi:hypothetical protein